MSEGNEVVPVNALVGRCVLSLATGNELGTVRDVFVDPLSGVPVGLTLNVNGETACLPYDRVHSFGHEAIMALADDSAYPSEEGIFADKPLARELIGTKIITDSGNLLGQIADIYVTLNSSPFVIYEIRESLLDRLLGRQIFLPASAGYALSDDRKRLIVPNEAAELAAQSIEALLDLGMSVRSVSATRGGTSDEYDDTVVLNPFGDDEDTVVRGIDEDETVIRERGDEEQTVLRWRPRAQKQ